MKVTERGTITLPKKLRERFGITREVEVEAVETAEGILIRKKTRADDPISKWRGALSGPADVDAYIEEIRGL